MRGFSDSLERKYQIYKTQHLLILMYFFHYFCGKGMFFILQINDDFESETFSEESRNVSEMLNEVSHVETAGN